MRWCIAVPPFPATSLLGTSEVATTDSIADLLGSGTGAKHAPSQTQTPTQTRLDSRNERRMGQWSDSLSRLVSGVSSFVPVLPDFS
jgi:hypothetical protein